VSGVEWRSLPSLWPGPAALAYYKDFMLLVFTADGVPTWEIYPKPGGTRFSDAIAAGTADTLEAAKSAALFEAGAQPGASE
jgi:hypothetical protein